MEENQEAPQEKVETKPKAKRKARTRKPTLKAKERPAINISEVGNAKEKPSALPKDGPSIVWFGEVDMNSRGVPSSDYPSYYFDPQTRELKNRITDIERGLDLDLYTGRDKVKVRQQLSEMKTRYDAIEASRPKLSGSDKDAIAKVFKDLGERIGGSMFTYSDMQRGTADAHVEADRMVNPCIEIKSQVEADYCRQRGIEIVNGKISRNHASQMAQLFGKVIGEGIIDMERFRNQR
jgi:hypothetical protein